MPLEVSPFVERAAQITRTGAEEILDTTKSFCVAKNITKAKFEEIDPKNLKCNFTAIGNTGDYFTEATPTGVIVYSKEGDAFKRTVFAKDKTVNIDPNKKNLKEFLAGTSNESKYSGHDGNGDYILKRDKDAKGTITKRYISGAKNGQERLYTVENGTTLKSKQYTKTAEAAAPIPEATAPTDAPADATTTDDKSTPKDPKKKDDKDKGGWKNWLIGGGIATAVLGGGYLLLHKRSPKSEHPEGAGAEGPAAAELAGAQPQLPEQMSPAQMQALSAQQMYQMPQGQGGMPGGSMNQLQLPGQMRS